MFSLIGAMTPRMSAQLVREVPRSPRAERSTKSLAQQRFQSASPCVSASAAVASKRLLVVAGASGQMGPGLIARAIGQGFDILACVRSPEKWKNTQHVTFVKTPELHTITAKQWKELLDKHGGEHTEISAVNLIGASIAPAGQTLEAINTKPVVSLMEALVLSAREQPKRRYNLQHLSSICATVVSDHPYARGRRETDEKLQGIAKHHNISFTAFRPGLIFSDMRPGNNIDMGHAYSPEQLAALPLTPVLGNGQQIQQPVYEGDLLDAVLNATRLDHQEITDALGPQTMTQKEMFEFFAKLTGRRFRPLHIPYPVAAAIAQHFPKGRIAPYAVAAFEALEKGENRALCDRKFCEILGRRTTAMDEVYRCAMNKPFTLAKAPLKEHTKEILRGIWANPEARKDLIAISKKYGLRLTIDILSKCFA